MTLTLPQMLAALTHSKANACFAFIFVFRYLRLVVHLVSFYFIYKATPIPASPTLKPSDTTVIIPTIDPENDGFQECLRSILQNQPGAILIVTVGRAKLRLVNKVIKPFRKSWPSTTISVTQTDVANKRRQVCHALPQVNTPITVLVDDHVYWPSLNFLPTILAPFEDPEVGGLGTSKVVRRTGSGYSIKSIANFLGCVYLERHNFEIAATNAIDGGVFVLSGRTAAYRTKILQDQAFINYFSYETFFFGMLGPILPDDDNALTRWLVNHGWKLKIQYCPDATIETDLGDPGKFLSQCLRWVRTTWRSNSCSLFTDRTVWRAQPWCVYAVYISSFFNFALFYDAMLLCTLAKSSFGGTWNATCIMIAWILASKMIKLIPHFKRCPKDILLIPVYVVFAYYHSLMKLWALFTFYDCAWGGRNLTAVDASAKLDYDTDTDSDDDYIYLPSGGGSPASSSYSTSSSYHTANSGTTASSGSSPRSGYTGASYGKQALFDRFYENSIPAPTNAPSPPPSSSGSSEESTSYNISKWAAWEKASYPNRLVNRAQPIPIHRGPTSYPQPPRAITSPQIKREISPRLDHISGVKATAWRAPAATASDPNSWAGRGHRSPINTRSRASASGSASSSTICRGSSSSSSSSSHTSFGSHMFSRGHGQAPLSATPREAANLGPPRPVSQSANSTGISPTVARTTSSYSSFFSSEPSHISSATSIDPNSTPSRSPTRLQAFREHAADAVHYRDTLDDTCDTHHREGHECAQRPVVDRGDRHSRSVKEEYRRRWQRGQDCQRQHDEAMQLKFGECNLGHWKDFAL